MTATDRLTKREYLLLAARYEHAAQESSSPAVRTQLKAIADTYVALAESTALLAQSELALTWLKKVKTN